MQWMFNSEANCNKKGYLPLQTVPIKQNKLVEVEILWDTDLTACSVSSALSLTAQGEFKPESANSGFPSLVMAVTYKLLDWFWGNGSAFPLVKLVPSLCWGTGKGKDKVAGQWLGCVAMGWDSLPFQHFLRLNLIVASFANVIGVQLLGFWWSFSWAGHKEPENSGENRQAMSLCQQMNTE